MSGTEYPKIDTLFDRRSDFAVDVERVRRPEFLVPRRYVVTEKIDGTNVRVSLETELRSGLDPAYPGSLTDEIAWVVRFRGHKENSQMPTFLLEHLQRTFTLERMRALWRCKKSCRCLGEGVVAVTDEKESLVHPCDREPLKIVQCLNLKPYPITLYGEGYGARIQKGGNYRRDGDVSCRLFDVLVDGQHWLSRKNVEDVARQLDVLPVPCLDKGLATDEIISWVRGGFDSSVAATEGVGRPAEGVVAFTDPALFNARGQRLIFKLKTKDFVAGKR